MFSNHWFTFVFSCEDISKSEKTEKTEKVANAKLCVENSPPAVLFKTKSISSERVESIAKNYDPVKNNYHPINDALWNEKEP